MKVICVNTDLFNLYRYGDEYPLSPLTIGKIYTVYNTSGLDNEYIVIGDSGSYIGADPKMFIKIDVYRDDVIDNLLE